MPLSSGVTPPRSGCNPRVSLPKESVDFASRTASVGAAPSGFSAACQVRVISRIRSAGKVNPAESPRRATGPVQVAVPDAVSESLSVSAPLSLSLSAPVSVLLSPSVPVSAGPGVRPKTDPVALSTKPASPASTSA
nr:hypothetical protein BJQ95_03722 [Cryobacterium sp. SO1]